MIAYKFSNQIANLIPVNSFDCHRLWRVKLLMTPAYFELVRWSKFCTKKSSHFTAWNFLFFIGLLSLNPF